MNELQVGDVVDYKFTIQDRRGELDEVVCKAIVGCVGAYYITATIVELDQKLAKLGPNVREYTLGQFVQGCRLRRSREWKFSVEELLTHSLLEIRLAGVRLERRLADGEDRL